MLRFPEKTYLQIEEEKCAVLVAEIEALWSRHFPNYQIADALMKEFGCNQISMLNSHLLAEIKHVWFQKKEELTVSILIGEFEDE